MTDLLFDLVPWLLTAFALIFAALQASKRRQSEPAADIITYDSQPPPQPRATPVKPAPVPSTGTVPGTVPGKGTVPTVPESEAKPEPEPKPTNREILYQTAYDCLGKDMAPTQNELGCAEALSFVMKKAGVKGLPKGGFTGTASLDAWLAKHLTRVTDPLPGDIIMSATGSGSGTVKHGHTGIVGKHQIMSNNSRTYKWDRHLTLDWWYDYYGRRGGMPVKFYRWP